MIRREETAGNIEIIGGKARRRSRGQVDYTLRLKVATGAQPVAVALIEAKRETLPPSHGLDQAKAYAHSQRLNVPFVFSSNGHQFVEYDRFTGKTADPKPMTEFPSPKSLRDRYEQQIGFTLEDEAAKPLLTPYYNGEGARRYYQDAAIRAVLEKIARCARSNKSPRALLSLATGAGKTFIAVNLLKRIADAGQLKRALFICDRDELRSQALSAFQNAFSSDAAEVRRNTDGTNSAKNARIHIATYQTLGVDNIAGAEDASFLRKHYPKNYFSHIVIDECHRSAWGRWSQVLTRNPDAVQIGLTATPRKLKAGKKTNEAKQDAQISADNQKYFGEPVYEYGMAQAMEDGYLAVCEIKAGRVNLDEKGLNLDEVIAHNPRDAITDRPVGHDELREIYKKTSYENQIMLPDRVSKMCEDLFEYLLETDGPEQKTIVFCARDNHADAVAITLNNLYAEWCTQNNKERLEPYAFKCTAASSGNDQLPDFRGAARHHFIATTVELLTTGVDVPVVRNIVFFKYIKSPISFYQMIGRGTRLDSASGKLMFRIYDYTGATELLGEELITPPSRPGGEQSEPSEETIVVADGFDVHITDTGRYVIMQEDGQPKRVSVDEYKDRLAAQLIHEAPTLEEFRQRWIQPEERRKLINYLVESGHPPSVLQVVEEMNDYDLYDVLADLGFGLAPHTRSGRAQAFTYKHEDWLKGLPEQTADAIRAIVSQFKTGGTDGLENPMVFQTPEVQAAGGLEALTAGGKPKELLSETKERIFST
ncbi:MAG: DEAD/DEAH box helicase family protein [Pseudohongiellaceae bacterium]